MSDDGAALRSDLNRIVAGRPVSLVGNAASLLSSRHGAVIDQGCVVRLNSGIPVSRSAQGRQIDIHCFSNRPSLEYNLRIAGWQTRLRRGYLRRGYPVWMSGIDRETCDDPDQAFYPLAMLEVLTDRLGARPSVGAMALDMLARMTTTQIRVFGFDFKASATFYRRKDNRGPHDWDAERLFALSLTAERDVVLFD